MTVTLCAAARGVEAGPIERGALAAIGANCIGGDGLGLLIGGVGNDLFLGGADGNAFLFAGASATHHRRLWGGRRAVVHRLRQRPRHNQRTTKIGGHTIIDLDDISGGTILIECHALTERPLSLLGL